MLRSVGEAAALIGIGIKNELAYKLDYLFSFGFRIVFALLMLFVWSAIYFASSTQSISGISLQQMYAYYFLAGVMYLIITTKIDVQLQSDITNGSVTVAFTRPINYAFQLFFNSFASDLLYMLSSIPLFIIATFFVTLSINQTTLVILAIEILIGYVLANLIGFMIGSLAVYMTQIWGVMSVTWSLEFLLAGGIMPLSLFPPPISNILSLLPFQMLIYTPVSTLLGTITSTEAISEIIVSAAWAAIFFMVAITVWHRLRKGLTSAGG